MQFDPRRLLRSPSTPDSTGAPQNDPSSPDRADSPSREPSRGEKYISVITDGLAISNYKGAENEAELRELRITGVLCLIERPAPRQTLESAGIQKFTHMPLEDGPHYYDHFRRCVEALAALSEDHRRVLVHCHAGRSRSVAVAAAFLGRKLNLDAASAVSLIAKKREINITPELRTSLERYLSETS